MEYQPSYTDSLRADILPSYSDSLMHYGVLGMKWGVRRYQNRDGTYTAQGKKHRKSKKSLLDRYNSLDEKTKRNIGLGIATVGMGIAANRLYNEYKPVKPIEPIESEPFETTSFKPKPTIDDAPKPISKRSQVRLVPGDDYMNDEDIVELYYDGDKAKYNNVVKIENDYLAARDREWARIDKEYRKRLDQLDSHSLMYDTTVKQMQSEKERVDNNLYLEAYDAIQNL